MKKDTNTCTVLSIYHPEVLNWIAREILEKKWIAVRKVGRKTTQLNNTTFSSGKVSLSRGSSRGETGSYEVPQYYYFDVPLFSACGVEAPAALLTQRHRPVYIIYSRWFQWFTMPADDFKARHY